jgi:hypothetical protein
MVLAGEHKYAFYLLSNVLKRTTNAKQAARKFSFNV